MTVGAADLELLRLWFHREAGGLRSGRRHRTLAGWLICRDLADLYYGRTPFGQLRAA